VEVKPGDAVLAVVMGWEVENFVKAVDVKKGITQKALTKKIASKKTVARQKTTT